MNVNMGPFDSNVAKLRANRELKYHHEAQRLIAEQKRNASMGLTIEKSQNKAKLEVSMININN